MVGGFWGEFGCWLVGGLGGVIFWGLVLGLFVGFWFWGGGVGGGLGFFVCLFLHIGIFQ